MSFLSKLKGGVMGATHYALPGHSGRGLEGGGLVGFAFDKAERMGMSAGLGVLKGYYRERFMWRGWGGDLLVGAGAAVAGALLNAMSHGRSDLALHLNRAADAGLMSHANNWGVKWGTRKAGRSVFMLPSTAATPAGATRLMGDDVLGMLPQALGGAYLTADELAQAASRR